MTKIVRSKKTLALLATCGFMFQFGGCLGPIQSWAVKGFGWQLGSLPAQAVYDLFIQPIIDDTLGGGGEEA